MSEMSLAQQKKQINNMLAYINLVCDDTKMMKNRVSSIVEHLRQDGLRAETADKIVNTYLVKVDNLLKPMIERMKKEDTRYLTQVMDNLNKAMNR